ncbi:MAG TPA: ribonuclease H-like domain-containing protein [Anaerolineales bacterium]|nr:ribonuclease H-like domain-containing protein [Anaerolineales bacterium]
MPTLSERLKAMGVKIGAQDVPAPKRAKAHPVEDVVPGRFIETGTGSTYVIEQEFPEDYIHGEVHLRVSTKPMTIAEWAGDEKIADQDPESLVFLDTETSGLAGGTGTFAFLVGVGRYTRQGFHLSQFFMRDPLEEPALLLALEEFLAPSKTIVSFNGKAFDVPLLQTRYTMQGWKSPLTELSHVDLLHLARRLWRDRLASRTLANLEVQILHASRTDEEIPGWMIPQMYFDYLRDGDARPLSRVFYHNAMDVVSLAALLNHTAALLENPMLQSRNEYIDLAAVARLLEELGHTERAITLYETCLQAELPEELFDDTLLHLSLIHKRNNNFQLAIPLWEQAVVRRKLYAYEELAKYYEHQSGELKLALKWTEEALVCLKARIIPSQEKSLWKPEFQHRLERLKRKLKSKASITEAE